jgi:hypothetical protein
MNIARHSVATAACLTKRVRMRFWTRYVTLPNIPLWALPELIITSNIISDFLLLQQVHNWLGLSLNFLREHSPASLPSITESAGTPKDSAENAAAAEPIIISPDVTPTDVPLMAEWELSSFKGDYGVIGGPNTQIPSETDLRLLCGYCMRRTTNFSNSMLPQIMIV